MVEKRTHNAEVVGSNPAMPTKFYWQIAQLVLEHLTDIQEAQGSNPCLPTMSRSYRKAIYKDKGLKKLYWKNVRSRINQVVREIKENPDKEFEIPDPKQIMNDYDYSDYTIDYEHTRSKSYFWYGKNYDDTYWKSKGRRK